MSKWLGSSKEATTPSHVVAIAIAVTLCADLNFHRKFIILSEVEWSWFFSPLNSLKNAKKHGSKRPNKNSQQISIITSENSGLNPNNHPSQMQQTQHQQIYDNRMNTQVKTYTDQGNGHNAMRAGNSSHYSKVRKVSILKKFFAIVHKILKGSCVIASEFL